MTYADWITQASEEERVEMANRIRKIIGTKEDARALAKDRTERVKAASDYDKAFERLAKVFINNGEKALAMAFTKQGNEYYGVTASGKGWTLYGNCGATLRSRYCGTLYIEGIGCVFTSGRLEKVFDYILNN